MIRDSFNIESRISGKNFRRYIDSYGGKAAGLMLLGKLLGKIRTREFEISHDHPYKNIGLVPHMRIHPEALSRRTNDNTLQRLHESVNGLVNSLRYRLYDIQSAVMKHRSIIARSSTTIEDWVDDSFYGTFLSMATSAHRYENVLSDAGQFRSLLDRVTKDFEELKSYPDYLVPENTRLGIIVMPWLNLQYHLTIYSSYPEKNAGESIIEVQDSIYGYGSIFGTNTEGRGPSVLYKITNDDIKMHYARAITESDEELNYNNPFRVDGKPSPLPEKNLRYLHDLVQRMQEELGYPIDIEAVAYVDKSSYDHLQNINVGFVQLRPVHVLESDRPVKNFTQRDEYTEIAKTPFVIGAYSVEAPIAKHNGKVSRGAVNIFPENVIIIDDGRDAGYRLHTKLTDLSPSAMITTSAGIALSHGNPILPTKPYRNQFRCMGMPGFMNWLERNLSREIYTTGKVFYDGEIQERDNTKPHAFARATLFPVLIESDGREGRVLVKNEYMHLVK